MFHTTKLQTAVSGAIRPLRVVAVGLCMLMSLLSARAGVVDTDSVPRPQIAFKTDLAYLALTVANVGAEVAWGKHWSVDLPLVLSPYTVSKHWRMRFYVIQPELRYWLSTRMSGHFVGLHIHTGYYNISTDRVNRYQDDELFVGGGVSYGYARKFSRHWSMEFTLGLGYVHTRYDVYHNNTVVAHDQLYRSNVPYNYFGITRVGVNLVYRFDVGRKEAARK